jgi:hypothetical protein
MFVVPFHVQIAKTPLTLFFSETSSCVTPHS